ncbi:MAG: GntR family transcriptional regulator [Burkholderiales bacterium]|nr:GntR family transcriptional regulator [Burkholderiales bacterium]
MLLDDPSTRPPHVSDESSALQLPLDRSGNLHDAVYERLRQALMDGHFTPGQTFTIRALGAVFGTSPMPARDALKRLVAERALELLPNRSVMLPVMTRARFQEILQVRLSLEPALASRGATKVTPAVIEAMAADHASMCTALAGGEPREYLAANRRFHFRLYEAAGSVVMLPVIEAMWVQAGPHLHQLFRVQERAMPSVEHHHTALLRALRRQDATAAAKAVWDDLSDAADSILAADQFDE